ncbi:uncharacterized protein LOC129732302 [Wyeomyia smithii]|uniref:uncharacterized protein LOC129732302 n=1 Tax=Wyeomyia smithii TaxID=174621 RepID=UPI002468215A|nr:uncharacterized protein LOC129732302 [Wyeomyia smithii]
MNEYLWEFAQKLPSENKFQIVLKSALSIKACAKVDVKENNDKWMCRKCKTLWMHGYFQVTEINATNKFDKTLEKYQQSLDLSRKQRVFQKYMQSRRKTTAKFTCQVCSYKTRTTVKEVETKSTAKVSKGKTGARTTQTAVKQKKSKPIDKRKKNKRSNAKPSTKKDSSFSTKNPNQLQALVGMLKRNSGTSSNTTQIKDRLKLMLH